MAVLVGALAVVAGAAGVTVLLELPRSATTHTAAITATASRAIWKGREIWAITPTSASAPKKLNGEISLGRVLVDTVEVNMAARDSDRRADSVPPARGAGALRPVGLACLVGLIVYLVVIDVAGDVPTGSAACPSAGAPEVVSLTPAALSPLRGQVAAVLPQRVGRLYEEGTVTAASAFSDAEPAPPPLSSTALRPGGYEMRWWAPNRDDIAADVFVFRSPAAAQRFLQRAVDPRCRPSGQQMSALKPFQAHNLAWINPDGFAQADVFFARGSRVYRVSDVPVGAKPQSVTLAQLQPTLDTVDALSCLLVEAHCSTVREAVPV